MPVNIGEQDSPAVGCTCPNIDYKRNNLDVLILKEFIIHREKQIRHETTRTIENSRVHQVQPEHDLERHLRLEFSWGKLFRRVKKSRLMNEGGSVCRKAQARLSRERRTGAETDRSRDVLQEHRVGRREEGLGSGKWGG